MRLGKIAGRAGARARRRERADAARVNAIFDDVDVVLGPTLAKAALPIGRYDGRGASYTLNGCLRWIPFNGVWNHLGNPAASVPVGFDAARPAAVGAARRTPRRRRDAVLARA